jgi:hypothetical protein
MEIRLRKNGLDPKELLIIKKAIRGERVKKARMDTKQRKLVADNETTSSRRIKTNDD